MTLHVQCLKCSRVFRAEDWELDLYVKEPALKLCTSCSESLNQCSFDEYFESAKSLISST